MATSRASKSDAAIQCMICMEYEPHLNDPKRLPCSHILCKDCLLNLSEVSPISFSCPTCRAVTEEEIESLPSATTKPLEDGQEVISCNVCMKKKVEIKNKADMFCYNCKDVFCDQHAGSHFDIYPEHQVVEIAVYKEKVKRFEKRTCNKHQDQELSLGCQDCLNVICLKCLPENTSLCNTGQPHKFTVLPDLVSQLVKQLDKLRAEAQQKEIEAERIVKDTMKGINNWDSRTQELIAELNLARDNHCERVKAEYAKLEAEIVKHREEGKKEIEEFLEVEASVKHTEIVRQLEINDARMSSYHQVDYVSNHKENLDKLKALATSTFQELSTTGEDTLIITEQEVIGDAEFMTASGDRIGGRPIKLPTKLTLIQETVTGASANTSCYYKGFVYVGKNGGTIDRIDEQGNVDNAFIKLEKSVISIAAKNGRLYCYMYGRDAPCCIFVLDLDGKQLGKWSHSRMAPYWGNRIVFISNTQLAVGDWNTKQIIIYSLTGDVIRTIPCPAALKMEENVAMTSCGPGFLVISDRKTAKVAKIGVEEGRLIWCVDTDPKPCGMILYQRCHLLVAHGSGVKAKITILDAETGQKLGSLQDELKEKPSADIFELGLRDSTLIVPTFVQKTVVFYKMY